ncbi:hypothetical protein M0R45_036172 [Rubus argutus]|uniref:Uncharacterized protein n=1 Tax=Rubus argutus TaxID=59490 RepID=A0AAW1VY27_RUBAR
MADVADVAVCTNNLRVWSQFGNVNITARDEKGHDDDSVIVTAEDEDIADSILRNSPWPALDFAVHVQVWPATKEIEDLPTY